MDDGEHLDDVVAAGQLRHHPTPPPVDVHLRGDDIRQHAAAILHDGGGGLITRGFQSKDEQGGSLLGAIEGKWDRHPLSCPAP
ncbi:hypothetical protein GCM10012319_55160 [Comamonas sp. KCTC 72670]|nr:hypothetical protein GCM10012319_55160 [Comamonas sp. KCTC 72670]